MSESNIFLTGASGSMGGCAFQELLKNKERFNITLLLRPSKKNKKDFKDYEGDFHPSIGERAITNYKGIKIVWGDIQNYEDVLKCVEGVDYVLHGGALISPTADHMPRSVWMTNYGGTVNIINAIKAQQNRDKIKFVSISSVATYGDRLPPVHQIRVGDPMYPSIFDFYSLSKIASERAVIESGLKNWVSIRQTYISIPNTMSLMDPIMTHQPLNQALEMVSMYDAGYGLVKTIDAPEDFWGKIYNMGGGPSCRINYYDYMAKIFTLIGCGTPKQMFERNWFATKNFHCGYFEDSNVLNDYLKFWRDSLEDHYDQVIGGCPWYFSGAKFAPKKIIKVGMRRFSDPLKWIKDPDFYHDRIKSSFGSLEKWKEIPDWNAPIEKTPKNGKLLEHGYEYDPKNNYTVDDLQSAAKFRGGLCLSSKFVDMKSAIKWQCAFGHKFEATPNLILLGGHWCPYCAPPDWEYGKIAKKNPFFAQVYYHNHSEEEMYTYTLEEGIRETEIFEKDNDSNLISWEQYYDELRKNYHH